MDRIRILVADDHSVMRMGLVALFETEADFSVVGEAEDGQEAIALASKLRPDVIVMDVAMPVMDGVSATAAIHKTLPDTNILVLTTVATSDVLAKALSSGARGALLKNAANEEIIAAIRSVARGESAVSAEICQIIDEDPPAPELTVRQKDVLSSIIRGLTNRDISTQLGICPDRVKDHINAIMQKLGAANRAEAVAIALRKHLLKI